MTDLLAPVLELAKLCGNIALHHYRTNLAVELKHDGSPVTAADRASELAAREWVRKYYPADGVLGEEFGEERADAPRSWIIDPIDGTKTFVRGAPLWGSLVALCEGERVLAGAAYYPAISEWLVAAPGAGCWWNDSRCAVSTVDRLDHATVLTTDERFTTRLKYLGGWRRLARASAVARTWGDCYGYLLVATGRAEVMVDPVMSPWDAAALQPIITEAGGCFTDWDGNETAFAGSVIATNRALCGEVQRVLAQD
jgi:histidinol-phosphatase